MPRCDLCFKEKSPLQPVLPKVPGLVCKGCFYEVDRVIGFLLHYGCEVTFQPRLEEQSTSKSRAKK